MNATSVILILALAGFACAQFPVNVTVTLAGGHSSTGKMTMDFWAGSLRQDRVKLQDHMQALNEGSSYSAVVNLYFPLPQVQSVSLMWFKKKLSFGSNTLIFRHISLVPLYASSLDQMRAETKVLCGRSIPTVGKSEYPVAFNIDCRSMG